MKKQVLLNDVFLRESEQVEGGGISIGDQDRHIKKIIRGGIDIIEIGFPGSSPENLARCRQIVNMVGEMKVDRKPILSGLARAVKTDIDAVKAAGCDMVHIYIPASDKLALAQFNSEHHGDTPEEKRARIIELASEMLLYAKEIGFEHRQYSPEDAARTGREYLCRSVEAVIDAGATSVDIPDTTGLRILGEYGDLIRHLFQNVPNIHRARIACHCHNDSDHGTANALQGIMEGVTEVQGTFYGLGERSGMTKFESVIMNVLTRHDIFSDVQIRFDPGSVFDIVHTLANNLGMPVPRHWVVAGSQNNICSSGTHQAIEAKAKEAGEESPYYGWDPKRFGHDGCVKTVLTQFSGGKGISAKLEELGFIISKAQLKAVSAEIKRISAGRKGTSLSDQEIVAVVTDLIEDIPFKMEIIRDTIVSGKGTIPMASVTASFEGRLSSAVRTGNGPISAAFDAVVAIAKELFPILQDFEISQEYWRPIQVTKGDEALGDVHVGLKCVHGKTGVEHKQMANAVHEDSNHAFVQAVANALSWMVAALMAKK